MTGDEPTAAAAPPGRPIDEAAQAAAASGHAARASLKHLITAAREAAADLAHAAERHLRPDDTDGDRHGRR